HDDLSDFLTAVQNGSIDNNWGNPGPDDDVQPDQINFSIMAPGTIFTMAGEQYRYLENQGGGNHLIILNDPIRHVSFNTQNDHINTWYDSLELVVQARVQRVSDDFITGSVASEDIVWQGQENWIPDNLNNFPEVASDVTQVDNSGTPRAFALSLADVTRLSGPGRAFSNLEQRPGANQGWWLLRTPSSANNPWVVHMASGHLLGDAMPMWNSTGNGGTRPALIVRQ
ncbi:hypothetical protein AALA52_10230, partial [Lactococcus ileimucosae]